MQARFISIKVDDRFQAPAFYTGVLGLRNREDLRCGESRRHPVTAPDGTSGIGMALEPMSFHDTCGNLINLVQHA